jgi:hypothetical protein
VPLVEDLIISKEYTDSLSPLIWLKNAMQTSAEQTVQVAGLTVGQRENSLWSAVRKLRFTASNFGPIIGAIRQKK